MRSTRQGAKAPFKPEKQLLTGRKKNAIIESRRQKTHIAENADRP